CPLEGTFGRRAANYGDPGGHFVLGSLFTSGRAHSVRCRDSLGPTLTGISGARTLLRLSRNRLFRGGGIRRLFQMVYQRLQAAAPAGLTNPGHGLEETVGSRLSIGPTNRIPPYRVRNRPALLLATRLTRNEPESSAQSCLRHGWCRARAPG